MDIQSEIKWIQSEVEKISDPSLIEIIVRVLKYRNTIEEYKHDQKEIYNLETINTKKQGNKQSKIKYKYRIGELIQRKPYEKNLIGKIVIELEKNGISQEQFYRYRKIPSTSKSSMPSDALFIFAKVFDCSIDDLVDQKSIKNSDANFKKRKFTTGLR